MNVIYPLYRHWVKLILDGDKPLEFRKSIPNDILIGAKLYLYETKRCGGQGLVVGCATVKSLNHIDQSKRRIGPAPSLFLYWAENIAKDEELVRRLKRIGEYDLPNYHRGTIYNFLFFDNALDIALEGKYPTYEQKCLHLNNFRSYEAAEQKTSQAIVGCDDWLTKIGYYDGDSKSMYTECIELESAKRFTVPHPITDFQRRNETFFQSHPQSFLYTPTEI